MAVQSYLPDRAGGLVAAGVFTSDEAARAAIRALHEVGLRWQDISVLAADPGRAKKLAEAEAWAPRRGALPLPFLRKLPEAVRSRYGRALAEGSVVVIAAAEGQPAETLAAVLEQARAEAVQTWWQEPANLFPPPEQGGRP